MKNDLDKFKRFFISRMKEMEIMTLPADPDWREFAVERHYEWIASDIFNYFILNHGTHENYNRIIIQKIKEKYNGTRETQR